VLNVYEWSTTNKRNSKAFSPFLLYFSLRPSPSQNKFSAFWVLKWASVEDDFCVFTIGGATPDWKIHRPGSSPGSGVGGLCFEGDN